MSDFSCYQDPLAYYFLSISLPMMVRHNQQPHQALSQNHNTNDVAWANVVMMSAA